MTGIMSPRGATALSNQLQADELENRLIDFGVRVIDLADAMPKTPAGKHIARQLLRSGTSPAPNYAEARGAESRKDFVHKLKIALKELNETSVWLRMIVRSGLLTAARLTDIMDENRQLCRILSASITTAAADLPPRPPSNSK